MHAARQHSPNTKEEHVYCTVEAFRMAYTYDTDAFLQVSQNFPEIRPCYDARACRWLLDKLHEIVARYIALNAVDKLNELNAAPVSASIKRHKREGLVRWLSLWCPYSRRFSLSSIMDEQGDVAVDANGCAELLRCHWQPTFSQKHIDRILTHLTKSYVQGSRAHLDQTDCTTFSGNTLHWC
jgi:hypothetical protein